MNEHSTWFHYLPGWDALNHFFAHYFERHWQWQLFKETHFTLAHVAVSALVALLLILGAFFYYGKTHPQHRDRLIPDPKLGIRNLFEIILDGVFGLAEGVMGREAAIRFLPLVATFFIFILFNNLIGLVPGFVPATDTLKTNIALSVTVFLLTHIYGVASSGPKYFAHFLGPVWYLSWLMLPIELISHIARPVSLALRLLGNMVGDHKVLSIFFFLVPLLVPLPFYILGMIVCIVQALVFTLLTMVYISQAMAHEEHH